MFNLKTSLQRVGTVNAWQEHKDFSKKLSSQLEDHMNSLLSSTGAVGSPIIKFTKVLSQSC